jgi:hypothetical protein
MPVRTMPSLPPRDGVDALLCAGIRACTSTISPVDSLSIVVGKSLPLPTSGEQQSIGGPYGAGGMSMSAKSSGPLGWVDGTLTQLVFCWVVNAITELGLSLAYSVLPSLPPTTEHGGETRRVDGTLAQLVSCWVINGSLPSMMFAGKTSWMPVITAVATWSSCSRDVGMTMLIKSST